MKKILSKQSKKGITLIALVVTIVVLLILAGVGISMLSGENGIIKQAQEAKYKTQEEGAKEQIGVEVTGSYGIDGKIDIEQLNENLGHIEGLTYKGASLSATNKIDKLPATVELDGVKVVINGDGSTTEPITGKRYETETKINVEGTPVTVPGNFTVSGLEEESTVEKGLVIYLVPEGTTVNWNDPIEVEYAQTHYDQFVWVPVPNAILDLRGDPIALSTDANIKNAVQNVIDTEGRYPMAIKKDETNYFGVLYDFSLDSTTNTVRVSPYSSWTPLTISSYREPGVVSSYDTSSYLPQVNGIIKDASYTDSTSFGNALQTEFNTMVNRVNNNEGFWVGRYETSGMKKDTTETYASTNEIKVNVVKGTDTGICNITWHRMYAQQQIYAKKAGITAISSMIWGSQWDQIMIWMKEVKNTTNGEAYVTNSVGNGNYGSISGSEEYDIELSIAKTGSSDNFKVKNVYDLAGNVYDRSLEAFSTNARVFRRR